MSIDRTAFNALVDDDGTNTTGSIWNKNQIKNVLLDPIDGAIGPGAWAQYAPTWASTGGGHIIGNGTLLGYYSVVNKRCFVRIELHWGSTTVAGSGGAFLFQLPFPSRGGVLDQPGAATLFNSAIGSYVGIATVYQGGYLAPVSPGAPNGCFGTLPFTWKTNDYLVMNGVVEIA